MQDYLCTVLWYLTIRGLSVNEIGNVCVSRERTKADPRSRLLSARSNPWGKFDYCVGRMTNWDEIKAFFQGLD